MPFQRGGSKVWWGSDNHLYAAAPSSGDGSATTATATATFLPYYSGSRSLEYQSSKHFCGNLSRIQEVDDEHNNSKLTWELRDSPGSLRSQDSGFSDNDELHNTTTRGICESIAATTTAAIIATTVNVGDATAIVDNANEQRGCSPVLSDCDKDVVTPPTVIRRDGSTDRFYARPTPAVRRTLFSGTGTAATGQTPLIKRQPDGELPDVTMTMTMTMTMTDATHLTADQDTTNGDRRTRCDGKTSKRRRRTVYRKPTRPLTPPKRRHEVAIEATDSDVSDSHSLRDHENHLPQYLNGISPSPPPSPPSSPPPPPPPYNNETILLGNLSALQDDASSDKFAEDAMSASTPKATVGAHFSNPLLNGHSASLQAWLAGVRGRCEHEVLSTLQAKSMTQEAFRSRIITTNTVAKLIQRLQQRALLLQTQFEAVERHVRGESAATFAAALNGAGQLVADVAEFTQVLERRAHFFADSRCSRRKYEQHLEQIAFIVRDTRISLQRQHYIHHASLLDDLLVLKRCLLSSLRLVYERLVRVIVRSIDHSQSDLLLRANMNMIATLSHNDGGSDGFASLADAFACNGVARSLLLVCVDHQVSSVRALALRALATVCCSAPSIAQLALSGGVEVLRDILHADGAPPVGGHGRRVTNIERREAIAVLTQITAAWHGVGHRVDGLRDSVECLVAALTQVVTTCDCGQTLILSAAALNNLSRIEPTAHYSIMSNDTLVKLIGRTQRPDADDDVSVFLLEQIATMLHNMSSNKRCHGHLANGAIVHFVTCTYRTQFYRVHGSRAECEAQRRTIKAILHTLTRLVAEAAVTADSLQLQGIPVLPPMITVRGDCREAGAAAAAAASSSISSTVASSLDCCRQSGEVIALARLLAKSQQGGEQATIEKAGGRQHAGISGRLSFNQTRQESYV